MEVARVDRIQEEAAGGRRGVWFLIESAHYPRQNVKEEKRNGKSMRQRQKERKREEKRKEKGKNAGVEEAQCHAS